MSTTECAAVNSRQWWENNFAQQWSSNNGRQQTACFMRQLIENLPDVERERRKWDDYYATQDSLELDEAISGFGDELAERIAELLPNGGKVLEAGCGEGWQSLALARKGGYEVSLLDFSQAALNCAERLYARHGVLAEFLREDAFAAGEPQWDLVFNAGVLEHYNFDQQAAFLRGMASRSRKYVLVLVPNRMCYWYWLWRGRLSSRGGWPYGKEAPMSDLSAAFEAAGLRCLGHCFGGRDWTEKFIRDIGGIDPRLCEEIIALHRSPLVSARQSAYLVAALGCKGEPPAVPACWVPSLDGPADFTLDQLSAALSDALAASMAAEHRISSLQDDLAAQKKAHAADLDLLGRRTYEVAQAKAELYLHRMSRGNRLLARAARFRDSWLTAAGLSRQGKRALRKPPAVARAAAKRMFHRLPLATQYRLRGLLSSLRRRRSPPMPVCATSHALETPGMVSVVLPVYNHAKMLPGAVESVLQQTYQNIELIIVNDGSRDGVEEVLSRWAGNPRVRILTQENQGLPKALSNGFEFARGEFRTWTSADNLMHPDQLRRQVAYLQSHPKAGMVFADYVAIDSAGSPLADPAFRPHNRRSPNDPVIHLPHDTRKYGQNADNYIGPCFMYRGWLGRLLGEYDPELGIEDFDYWLRLSLAAPIEHLDSDEPLYSYRVHEDSLSGRAEELQIPRRAQELIGHHRRREQYFAQPWTIHADSTTLRWLTDKAAAPHRVAAWSETKTPPPDGRKHLWLLSAESLPRAAAVQRSAETVVAAWFPDEPAAVNRFRNEAQGTADVCFASDEAVLSRLALLSSEAYHAAPGEELVRLAARWADVRTFRGATRPPAQRARRLPEVFHPLNRPNRLLLQADGFTHGGMEQVIIDLARSLREDGFELSLLVLGQQGPDAERIARDGVPVLTLPTEDRDAHYRRLLRERRIELVNAHYSLYGANLAADAGVPFVQSVHTTYIFLDRPGIEGYQANDQYTSAYVCVSQAAAYYSAERLGLPPTKMIVAPNGVDVARIEAAADQRRQVRQELGLSADDFVFLHVGTVQPIKCQLTLVKAFAELSARRSGVKLLLVGDVMRPEYLADVRREIAARGLEKAVLVLGRRDDVPRLHAAADAFVLPSLCEGWSLALGEALAAGLPAAATAVGSAPDLLPRCGGRLIRPPFSDIAEVDYATLGKYACRDEPEFVAEIAAAMEELCRGPGRHPLPADFRDAIDCRQSYKPYSRIFRWLMQGGPAAAARAWTFGRRADDREMSSAEPAPLEKQHSPLPRAVEGRE